LPRGDDAQFTPAASRTLRPSLGTRSPADSLANAELRRGTPPLIGAGTRVRRSPRHDPSPQSELPFDLSPGADDQACSAPSLETSAGAAPIADNATPDRTGPSSDAPPGSRSDDAPPCAVGRILNSPSRQAVQEAESDALLDLAAWIDVATLIAGLREAVRGGEPGDDGRGRPRGSADRARDDAGPLDCPDSDLAAGDRPDRLSRDDSDDEGDSR
jgi:hypothetical protein